MRKSSVTEQIACMNKKRGRHITWHLTYLLIFVTHCTHTTHIYIEKDRECSKNEGQQNVVSRCCLLHCLPVRKFPCRWMVLQLYIINVVSYYFMLPILFRCYYVPQTTTCSSLKSWIKWQKSSLTMSIINKKMCCN